MKSNLKTIINFPHKVRCEEVVWIPMRDGLRLSGRLWLPENAGDNPVPAILEYIPYRKRDFTRVRDDMMHPYIAGHGYACLRVDLRGSGDSDGVLIDEYGEQELTDGLDVLRWLAEQPWCTGDVGMIGISWGGFNGLQIAALRPPELKAVISLCSTDDRYADDIHHMGGCLLGDNLSWASVMFSYNSLPPDPEVVGSCWREKWHQRLEGSGLWLDTWLRHQWRDEYWQHGSICENYDDVQVPVYAISGWADGYTNAVFRLIENLSVPRKGLVGPWGHKYPHVGVPGPAIGFLQEALRWWDKWLKDIETGIMAEPMLRVWMQDSVPPIASYDWRPGRWVGEPCWPSKNIEQQYLWFMPNRIVTKEASVEAQELTIQSPLTVGLFAGKWCSYAAGPDLAHDQRQEDGGALVFDSDPLDESLEILGIPCVHLEFASDKPLAMVAVRLSDIAPDDNATRVSYGLLNLTHRDGSESPSKLERGHRYRTQVKLNHVAQVFPAGHRLRVAISTSYWPIAWPSPESVRLTVYTGNSGIDLPVRLSREGDECLTPFGGPEAAPATPGTIVEPGHNNWLVHRDLATDESTLEVINDDGTIYFEDIDLQISKESLEWYCSRANDLTSIRGETRLTRTLKRDEWIIKTVAHTVLTSDTDCFRITADLDAFEGNTRVFCKSWHRYVPRELV